LDPELEPQVKDSLATSPPGKHTPLRANARADVPAQECAARVNFSIAAGSEQRAENTRSGSWQRTGRTSLHTSSARLRPI
jgi:hypothetical protein